MKLLFDYENVNILMCDQSVILSDSEKTLKIEYTTRFDFLGPLMVLMGFPDITLTKCQIAYKSSKKYKDYVLPLDDYETILYLIHDKLVE